MTMSFMWIRKWTLCLAILNCFLIHTSSQAEQLNCPDRYALLIFQQDSSSPLKMTPLLRTEAGFSIDLSENTSGNSEIFDVLLEIPSAHLIDSLVQTLAVNLDPNEIIKKIKDHLAKNPLKPISLKEVGPAVMRERTNSSAIDHGPNCWNAALSWYFPKTVQEYTPPETMESALKTRFKKLTPEAPLNYGDLIAFRRSHFGSDYLLHTAVYLGGGLVWHKGSSSKNQPYVFSTLRNLLQNYKDTLSQGGVYQEVYRLTRQP